MCPNYFINAAWVVERKRRDSLITFEKVKKSL